MYKCPFKDDHPSMALEEYIRHRLRCREKKGKDVYTCPYNQYHILLSL
jgi:hypothetical protein